MFLLQSPGNRRHLTLRVEPDAFAQPRHHHEPGMIAAIEFHRTEVGTERIPS